MRFLFVSLERHFYIYKWKNEHPKIYNKLNDNIDRGIAMENGYYMDDGTKVDIDSIPIPTLCLSCLKEKNNEIACNITRMDQINEIKSGEMFCCFAYEPNNSKINKESIIQEMEKYLANKTSKLQ